MLGKTYSPKWWFFTVVYHGTIRKKKTISEMPQTNPSHDVFVPEILGCPKY